MGHVHLILISGHMIFLVTPKKTIEFFIPTNEEIVNCQIADLISVCSVFTSSVFTVHNWAIAELHNRKINNQTTTNETQIWGLLYHTSKSNSPHIITLSASQYSIDFEHVSHRVLEFR